MSNELVPINDELASQSERSIALQKLNQAAETADTEAEAREVMVKAKTIADLLVNVRAPFEDARLAGKASVVAARRLSRMLNDLSSDRLFGGQRGARPSERTQAMMEIGIGKRLGRDLRRLSGIADADFQRYIQRTDKIPSISGCLRSCAPELGRYNKSESWKTARRKNAGVKTPTNPSYDEAYSLIVRALGHLSAQAHKGNYVKQRAISGAIDHLYAAEDRLRPYRGGYSDGEKAA